MYKRQDDNGDLFIVMQGTYPSLGFTYIRAVTCSASQYSSTKCVDTDDWTMMPSGSSYDTSEWRLEDASDSNALDTDVAPDGTVYVAYVEGSSGNDNVKLAQLGTSGFMTEIDTGGIGTINLINSSLALDIGLEGSFHLSYLNGSGGLSLSHCSSGCGSASSWSTEQVDPSYETGVFDMSVGPDLSVVILAGTDLSLIHI